MDRDEDNEKDDDDDDDHEEGEPMNMRKRLLKLAGHDPVSVFTFFLPVVSINPLSANPTKCSNTQTIRRLLPTNCFSVFDHFVGLALEVF